MSSSRAALRAKQLLGMRPGDNILTVSELPTSCADIKQSDSSWNIKAFFKQQRLPGAAAMRRALQRPCKQQAAPAAEDEAVGSAARARAATPLQTALSIQPIPEGDSLDSMLVSLPPLPSLGRHSRPAPGRMSLPLGVQLWGAQSGSAAGSRAPSDTLEAVLAELAAVQQNTAQQAAMLAEGRACASSMQQQVALVQGQLSECEAQIATAERQAAEAEAAARAEQGSKQQAAALQRELLHLSSSTAAEQRQLEAAAKDVRRRAEALRAAAHERYEAAAGWQRRVELMAATHQPLTREEEQRRNDDMLDFWSRCA